MPSSSSNTFRFRPLISTLLTMLGALSPSILIIYADAAPSSIIEFLRSIPTNEGLGKLIEELAGTVERYYGDSSPLKENSVRTWAFLISRSIHKCTRDAISGSLACSVLISFLLSRDETPSVYVLFALWGVLVVLYLAKHRAPIPQNDSD